jgi:glycosyltransferase involved in cell wall biosynthesis
MITMVIPTRDRAHTLREVAPSYFRQDGVSEIVFVIDAGSDDTATVVDSIAGQFPGIRTKIIRNPARVGASQSRNLGVAEATNAFVLFCDDDEYLEPGYAQTCLRKLLESESGAVSGRRVYMLEHETSDQAVRRFGGGMRNAKPFRPLLCEYVNGAKFAGDIRLPFTNAVIMTHRSLLLRFPFDPHYARGNGYREETDYQMNLFVHGYSILVTNDVHSVHLHASRIRRGGQVVPRWRRVYWSVHYTRYFYRKYYAAYAARIGLSWPRWMAVAAFAAFAVYREYLRPALYGPAVRIVRWRRGGLLSETRATVS